MLRDGNELVDFSEALALLAKSLRSSELEPMSFLGRS